jgi:hypothetical protein
MNQVIYRVYQGLAWLIFACMLLQFFLAGVGVFRAGSFGPHLSLGNLLIYASIVLLILAVVSVVTGTLDRWKVGSAALLVVLMLLQYRSVSDFLQESTPLISALHPVNGLLLVFVSYIVANGGERPWTAPIIIRGGGLAAVAAGVLLIIAVLLQLVFVLGQVYFTGGVDILDASVSGFEVLLLLGLVGLYVHVLEEAGLLGLVGFLVAFVGTALGTQGVGTQGDLWALLLADLGFALFGVASLRSGVYPRRASILLIIGAVLSGVAICVHEFIGVGMLGMSIEVIGDIGDIIFSASLVWLGLSLFRHKAEEVQRPHISRASESI